MTRHHPEPYENNACKNTIQVQKPISIMAEKADLKSWERYTLQNIKLVKYLALCIAVLQQYFLNKEESPPEVYLLEQGFIVMNLAC